MNRLCSSSPLWNQMKSRWVNHPLLMRRLSSRSFMPAPNVSLHTARRFQRLNSYWKRVGQQCGKMVGSRMLIHGGVSFTASYMMLQEVRKYQLAKVHAKALHVDQVLAPEAESGFVEPKPENLEEEACSLAQGYVYSGKNASWIQPFWDFYRFIEICVRMFPVAMMYPCTLLIPSLKPLWYRLVLHTCEKLGACFIKFGQWIATRPDIFAEEVCDQLSWLHSSAPAHSAEVTRRIIEQAYRRPIEDIFISFESEPVASGAIAQVHRAVIKDEDGNLCDVAVKVQHPGVARVIDQDIRVMRALVKLKSFISDLSHIDFETAFREFHKRMADQVNFCIEANNLERFRKNFAKFRPVIDFPKPYLSFCKPTVLVESYVKAESLSSFLTHDPLGSKLFRQRLASVGMTAFLKMILVDNFTHADLHPGNILVSSIPAEERNSMDVLANGGERTISKENHQGKSFGDLDIPCITFLDAGIIAELSQEDRTNFLDVFTALARGEAEYAAELMVERARSVHPLSKKSLEEFRKDMAQMLMNALSKPLSELDVGSVVDKMLETSRQHGVDLDTAFVSVLMSVGIIQGIAQQLNEKFDLMSEARPLVQSNAKLVGKYLKHRIFRGGVNNSLKRLRKSNDES